MDTVVTVYFLVSLLLFYYRYLLYVVTDISFCLGLAAMLCLLFWDERSIHGNR
jgi:hypothetical protein